MSLHLHDHDLLVTSLNILNNSNIPYSGKFLKGLIFENFENTQAFLKISFEIAR